MIFKRTLSTVIESFQTPSALASQQKYQQKLLTQRFINSIMVGSEKCELMENHLSYGLFALQKRTNQNPVLLFSRAIAMLSPVIACGSHHRGSKILRVPVPITQYRGEGFACRWMKEVLRKKRKPPVPFEQKFADEVIAILQGKSALCQKKAQLHREALANRANAPMRWAVGYKM